MSASEGGPGSAGGPGGPGGPGGARRDEKGRAGFCALAAKAAGVRARADSVGRAGAGASAGRTATGATAARATERVTGRDVARVRAPMPAAPPEGGLITGTAGILVFTLALSEKRDVVAAREFASKLNSFACFPPLFSTYKQATPRYAAYTAAMRSIVTTIGTVSFGFISFVAAAAAATRP